MPSLRSVMFVCLAQSQSKLSGANMQLNNSKDDDLKLWLPRSHQASSQNNKEESSNEFFSFPSGLEQIDPQQQGV